MASPLKHKKLSGALGILAFLLLSYPLLQIFNNNVFIVGISLLFLYIFGVWILAIIGLFALSRRLASLGTPGEQEPKGHDQ